MLLNHIGVGFRLSEYSSGLFFFTELIGKLTFPIMAYLLVEGFHYTRNVTKYALRLTVFWIISIYPFHLLFYWKHSFSSIELFNNIFFTLLMGLLLIISYEKLTILFCTCYLSFYLHSQLSYQTGTSLAY